MPITRAQIDSMILEFGRHSGLHPNTLLLPMTKIEEFHKFLIAECDHSHCHTLTTFKNLLSSGYEFRRMTIVITSLLTLSLEFRHK